MEILVLGGTGAMGMPLVNKLSKREDCHVYVTSRRKKKSKGNIEYIQGNAKDDNFMHSLMNKKYDAIVDFMVYSTNEFKNRIQDFLDCTDQYFYFSSARCYADSSKPITEESLRLIDSCDDNEYLSTDEYALAKGKEENILFQSGKKNWTIIRPYITYNSNRIQLGVYEKEDWLKRALEGRTVVFPRDIAKRKTTMTYGPDVAEILVSLIGNKDAYGQAFSVTTSESHTWEEILNFYSKTIEAKTGKKIKIKYVQDSNELQKVWGNKWQICYDRLYDREFDNTKIEKVSNNFQFKPLFNGIEESLNIFLENPVWIERTNVSYEAWCDRTAKEITPLNKIYGKRNKIVYLKKRIIG